MLVGLSEGLATAGAGYSTSYTTGYSSDGGFSTYTTRSYSPAAASMASMASAERVANFGLAMEQEQNVKRMGYLKRNTIQPGETVTGFVHVDWERGRASISSSTSKGLNTSMNGASTGKVPSPDNRRHHRYNSPTAGPFRPGGKVVANPTDIGSAGRVCACPEEKNGQQFG